MISEPLSRLPQVLAAVVYLLLWFECIGLSNANSLNCVRSPTRPFYLMGHMCNSIDEVKKFVSAGANSVEIDIQFTEDGLLHKVFHGLPCDIPRYCFSSEDVDAMFEYLKEISTPGNPEFQPHFTLVLMDLKIKGLNENAKRVAGTMMADKLINILFESEQGLSRLKVVVGLELIADYPFVWTLVDRFNQRSFPSLLDRIGFDVSGNEDIEEIEYLWKYKFENKLNVWQGDGITNCLSPWRSTQRLKELLRIRDSNLTESYTAKVYHWTIDLKWAIRDSLRLGVDGMITNEVSNVVETLNEHEFKSSYHLANNDDDPFCVVREPELQAVRQSYQFSKLNQINNLMITNYVMQGAGSGDPQQQLPTTSQTIRPKMPIINNNFETDNLIRTGNDFKRTSFSDFNLRQMLSQLLAFLGKRNNQEGFMRFRTIY